MNTVVSLSNKLLKRTFKFYKLFSKPTPIFGSKPIRNKTVLVWDLENIAFRHYEDIVKKLDYTPQKAFIVTSQKLGKRLVSKISKKCFDIYDGLGDSDYKIKRIMNISSLNNEFIIISSDADFVDASKKWTMPIRNWSLTISQLNIHFKERLKDALGLL